MKIYILVSAIFLVMLFPRVSADTKMVYTAGELPHRQEVWVHALEWCESSAMEKINPNDKDNTPSYYFWQFKPDTFKEKAEKYGVIEKGQGKDKIMVLLKDYELQHKTINAMVRDGKNQNWGQLFPDCVKRLGTPPL